MKFLFTLMALSFSLNSFAYLMDYPINDAKRILDWATRMSKPQNLDTNIEIWQLDERDFETWNALVITDKKEYLTWKDYTLLQISRALDFIASIKDKPLASDDKRFLIQAEYMLKSYQIDISNNYMGFGKYKSDVPASMMSTYPELYIVFNVKKVLDYDSIDERIGMLDVFHELVHHYYYHNNPGSGPDSTRDEKIYTDCHYQENLAWEAHIRFYRLLNNFDRPTNPKNFGEVAVMAYGNPSLWKAFLDNYCRE